jgi:bisphosphoglycerate-dependent phosphoglycerate mutase
MITIDDVEYKEDDLSEISKIHVKRINDLRTEVVNLQMMLEEKNVLISAYANAIKESVKEVEDTDAEVVNE